MQQLLRDLEAVILKTFVWQGLFNETKGLTGISSFFNSIIKGLGGFAAGGSVDSGTPIVVGEQGPEIFMPYAAGNIVPNGKLGGTVINNNYNIDARGADASVEFRIRRAIAESQNQAVAKSVVAVREMQLRTT
jgi:phage-related minor tail protein